MTAARTKRWIGLALLLYGSVGIVVMLRLLPLLVQAVSLWLGGNATAPHPAIPGLGPLEAHFDPRPWLAWCAWLIGLLLIAPPPQWLKGVINHPTNAIPTSADAPAIQGGINPAPTEASTNPAATPSQGGINPAPTEASPIPVATQNSKLKIQNSKFVVPALLIIATLAAGAYTRLNLVVPQEKGLIEYPYDDEGVYAEASQLTLQGIVPYRDYFFAHPPVAAWVYTPAFAYHFNAWGSPTSFMLGRYLSVAYSLLTALALFLLARKAAQGMGVGGLPADFVGGLAALLWAVDGEVVDINRKVMLDQPMVLFSSLGLLFYLYALPRSEQHAARERRWLILAGIFIALAALTKIAGLAAAMALFTHAIATALERRTPPQSSLAPPSPPPTGRGDDAPNLSPELQTSDLKPQTSNLSTDLLRSRWFNLKWLTLGFGATAAIIVIPYLIVAGGQMVREVFFFQLLRPGDGTADVSQRLPLISGAIVGAITANPLTLICAALGCLLLGWGVARGARLGGWTPIVLWGIFSFALFTYTRSFYTHYYIQLAAPLCLLGGAAALWPEHRSRSLPVFFYPLVSAAVAVLLVPTLLYQWGTTIQPHPNPMFRDVAKYVTDATPPGTNVLTLDDQFNFLAGRPPSYLPSTGYLVDSYGHMIYLGLGISQRSITDLIGGVFHDPRSNDVYATMWLDAPQADMLQRIAAVPLIVTHDVGEGRLRKDTLAKLGQLATLQPAASTSRYTIYRK